MWVKSQIIPIQFNSLSFRLSVINFCPSWLDLLRVWIVSRSWELWGNWSMWWSPVEIWLSSRHLWHDVLGWSLLSIEVLNTFMLLLSILGQFLSDWKLMVFNLSINFFIYLFVNEPLDLLVSDLCLLWFWSWRLHWDWRRFILNDLRGIDWLWWFVNWHHWLPWWLNNWHRYFLSFQWLWSWFSYLWIDCVKSHLISTWHVIGNSIFLYTLTRLLLLWSPSRECIFSSLKLDRSLEFRWFNWLKRFDFDWLCIFEILWLRNHIFFLFNNWRLNWWIVVLLSWDL